MLEIEAATFISAPAKAVWTVLTDFRSYCRWNPFIRAASGTPQIGEEVRVRVRSSMGIPLHFRAIVLNTDECRELHWEGHLIAPWIAKGEHWFQIEPVDDTHVRFVQRERFSGLLPGLAARLLAREARRGFRAMNDALAAQATTSQAS